MLQRNLLPQQKDKVFITDGGLETTALFKDGIELPGFSSIHLMRSERGLQYLRDYFADYIELARSHNVGLILETPTWRSSWGWADVVELKPEELVKLTEEAARFLVEIKNKYSTEKTPMVVAGCVGPRGDGYKVGKEMSAEEAANYHFPHIQALKNGGADFISALTLTYPNEALGIIQASKELGIPVVISFTVETDGRLPNGDDYLETIEKLDQQTEQYVSYFMINCAHPTHFNHIFRTDSPTKDRIGGVRANASCKSHEELDNSTELDEGDPKELGRQIVDLQKKLPNLKVLGGCCGTDIRHIRQICLHR